MKELLNKLITEYRQELNDSNQIMKELNKELEENDGAYPNIEFGQEYESALTANFCYSNFLSDLNNLKKSLEKNNNKCSR